MTQERIEDLYRSGVITFNEALELAGKKNGWEVEYPEQLPENELTKEEMIDDFIDNMLEPVTEYENGEYVTYNFMNLDEVLDYLERNQIKWRGETPTIEIIEKEIKSLTRDALIRCIGFADEGYEKEQCNCWTEGTCFRVDVYFEGNDKNISIDVKFIPEQGFTIFDYEKYKLLKN